MKLPFDRTRVTRIRSFSGSKDGPVDNGARIEFPELFFGLCGPIGVNLEVVSLELDQQLSLFGYASKHVHLTEFLKLIDPDLQVKPKSLEEHYNKLIDSADAFRELFGRKQLMSEFGLFLIREKRKETTGDPAKPARKTAYIIRQLKRPEEIELLREIYGKQVFQVSAYMDQNARRLRLASKMRDYDNSSTRTVDFEGPALTLVKKDDNEPFVEFGQRMKDVYPLADVFIDATTSDSAKSTINRFLRLIFGSNFVSPSRDEHGMYVAKSASLRSVDLSRQVGAAIFNPSGAVKVLGCNEVPSPNGGTYWEGDDGDSREFKIGRDTNEDFKYRLLGDTIKSLAELGLIGEELASLSTHDFIKKMRAEKGVDLSKRLMIMDMTEYGRIIHAEMNAITDAARHGISIDGDYLFCTTFPCHLCAKHIISSGIKRVIYIEPYPKSYATELYMGDIILERRGSECEKDKVCFEPFIGIAPFRYRDFFEKSKRKDGAGKPTDWRHIRPMPDINIKTEAYILTETDRLRNVVSAMAEKQIMLPDRLGNQTAPVTASGAEKSAPELES